MPTGGRTLSITRRNRPNLRGALLAVALATIGAGLSAALNAVPAAASTIATDAKLEGDRKETVFSLTMTAGVPAEVFTLANPYRVIIDMPDVSFRLPASAGQTETGLVKAYRYGLFGPRKSRIVMDTVLPVAIAHAEMVNVPDGKGVQLNLLLRAIDAAAFGTGTGATRPQAKPAQPAEEDAAAPAREPNPKPVIVLDPGHGGIDPGALGVGDVYEKTVVLEVAKQLQAELKKRGRYVSHMTRSDDVFVALDDRLKFSAEKKADLFISLHADALADTDSAKSVRGATVYTLSERASDAMARRMADKENSADAVAGLAPTEPAETHEVRGILADLLKRETANFSSDFSATLVGKMRRNVNLSRAPERSAAFRVLQQTRTPSVLIELGYLSNPDDQKLMTSQKWREAVATSIADAVDAYFARR